MTENGSDGQTERKALTRRDLIKRAAIVGGAAVWAAPVIRMMAGSGAGPAARSLDGVQLASFHAPCVNTLLQDPLYVATICAKTASAAATAFTSQAKTACTSKCTELGPCVTGTCKPPAGKSGGPTIGTVTCTGPGADCPAPPYARNTKVFVCSAIVTCKCVCR